MVNNIGVVSSAKLMRRVLSLSLEGFRITFGPTRPNSKVIEISVKKQQIELTGLIDLESGVLYKDPTDALEYTIDRFVYQINDELAVRKGES